MAEEKTRRMIRAYLSVPVEGGSYPEMDAKARAYAARFFHVGEEDLVISTIPTIALAEKAPWSEDPSEPDRWRATFRVGCLHSFGPNEHIPAPEGDEDDGEGDEAGDPDADE
jgi:hypothetical protein